MLEENYNVVYLALHHFLVISVCQQVCVHTPPSQPHAHCSHPSVSIKSVKIRSFPSLYLHYDHHDNYAKIKPSESWLATVCLDNYSEFLFLDRFERAIADFGMNTGVIATGLILLRMVDPESRSPVPADFAFKQLLHSPFMGGGIWTCLALPLLNILKYEKY